MLAKATQTESVKVLPVLSVAVNVMSAAPALFSDGEHLPVWSTVMLELLEAQTALWYSPAAGRNAAPSCTLQEL